MKIYIIIQYILFKAILSFNPIENFADNSSDISDIFFSMIQVSKDILKDKLKNITLEDKCLNLIEKTYLLDDKNKTNINKLMLYYIKIFLDSSKNKNDISTFNDCMRKRYGYNLSENEINHFSYLLTFIDKRNRDEIDLKSDTTYLFGVCAVHDKMNGCSDEDYEKILQSIISDFLEKIQPKKNEISFFSFEDYTKEYYYKFFSLNQIPLYFIILHFIFFIFNKYILKFFRLICLSKNKEKEDKNRKNSVKIKQSFQSNQTKKINYQKIIDSVFSISKNIEILFNKDKEQDINNDNGISYIKGMKGLSMIFYTFGTLYINLYNSPISMKNRVNFYQNLKNIYSWIFYFGIKYAPRILLSCSGYSLFYKFISYLDEKTQEEKEENNKTHKNFTYYTNVKMLYYFIGQQIHKYIIFLLVTNFFIFSIYSFNLIFIDINPMWVYFDHTMIKNIGLSEIILNFFGIRTYFFPKTTNDNILNHFWLLYNEIIFFIITSILIYLAYKYNLNLNRFILILLFIFEIFKPIYIYFLSKIINPIFSKTTKLNPTFIYSYHNYGRLYVSPFMNYNYYLIGVFFSMINYSIQKSLNFGECSRQEKNYLLSSVKAVKKLKQMNKFHLFLWGIIFIILIIIFSFSQSIFFYIIIDYLKKNSGLEYYSKNMFIHFFMIYDAEIVVILFNLLTLFFYISGENVFDYFFTHQLWYELDKMYFTYILLLNPVILYILYLGETKIQFNIPNCFLYSLISIIVLFFVVISFYILFELPYKRIIKYNLKIQNNLKKERILGGIENQINMSDSNFTIEPEEEGEDNDDNEENISIRRRIQ